jgi:small subunit ribosomal protein S1
MIATIGNPELEFLFEEDSFKKKRRSLGEIELSKIYESTFVDMPEEGQIVSAVYAGETKSNFIFSVRGYKDDVRVDNRLSEAKYLRNSEIGDVVDVLIVNVDHNNFYIKGSISTLYENRAHQTLQSLKEGESVTAHIKSLNPAGYDVEIKNGGVTLPGFMPNTLAGINKLYDPTSIVGDTFQVMIESYAEQEGTYIVSRRKYLQTLIPQAIKELNFDNTYRGHVTGTTPFGVFVEFNECLTGMIHKANVHPDWQERLSEIKPGFEIEFYIKEIVKEKIILTQILRETLWDNIKNGQVLKGVVKDVKQFGTLVNLDDETVGLIHTSEMEKLKMRFQADQELKVKVLSVDRASRKIFLTLA